MNETEKRIIQTLQQDLPLTESPFADLAAQIGISEEELLAKLAEWKESKTLRRFGAILRHHHAGFSANAMVAWTVAEERMDEVGSMMASFPEISHCYERPPLPDFPYNLYTMIHARSPEECTALVEKLSRAAAITEFQILYTTHEYKKTSPVYFHSGKS